MDLVFMTIFLAFFSLEVQGDDCGTPAIPPDTYEDRITGGTEAVQNSWPWQVAVREDDGTGKGVHFCGGALIGDQWVLTAAHCVKPKLSQKDALRIHLGAHYLSSQVEGEQVQRVSDIILHPEYVGSYTNDIALLRLENQQQFTNTIIPVCLSQEGTEVPAGTSGYVTGWGSTTGNKGSNSEVLKQAIIKAMSFDECDEISPKEIFPSLLCAWPGNGASCYGDSGGPLVVKQADKWYLVGTVQGGPRVCDDTSEDREPMYFSKVSSFRKWIDDTTGASY